MTTQRAIKILNQMLLDCKDCAKMDALAIAIAILEKENEPAPAEADTSSNNNLQLNDTTRLKICQDVIGDIKKDLLSIYELMSGDEHRAFGLGEIFGKLGSVEEAGGDDA